MYKWAANTVKLQLAIRDLENFKKLGQPVEVNEETIKARYILRGGLVLDESKQAQVEEVKVAPRINRRK
jgi:hypothetical protein